MTIFLTVLHIMVCAILVIVVLLQHGKGADIGAVFGGGASNTVFGSRGAGNFLTRLTTGSAILFMVTSLCLSYIANTSGSSDLFQPVEPVAEETSPFGEEAPAEPSERGAFEEVPPAETGGFEEVAPPEPAEGAALEAPPVEDAPAEAPREPPVSP